MSRIQKPFPIPRPKLHVTQEIIDNACQENSRFCPIAEAIRQQIKGATLISVDLGTVRYSNPEKGFRYVFPTPHKAQEALILFDQGQPIEPFTFEMRYGVVTSMRQHKGGKRERIHKLGKAQLIVHQSDTPGAPGLNVERIGGKTPRKHGTTDPKTSKRWRHASDSSMRIWGVKGFAKDWKRIVKET
jgi:hypothetical protein